MQEQAADVQAIGNAAEVRMQRRECKPQRLMPKPGACTLTAAP